MKMAHHKISLERDEEGRVEQVTAVGQVQLHLVGPHESHWELKNIILGMK